MLIPYLGSDSTIDLIGVVEEDNKYEKELLEDRFYTKYYDLSHNYFVKHPIRLKILRELLIKLETSCKSNPKNTMEISKFCKILDNI